MDFGNATAQRCAVVHLGRHVRQEQHLAVAGTGDEGIVGFARMTDLETPVAHPVLAAHVFQVFFPTLAVWRVG